MPPNSSGGGRWAGWADAYQPCLSTYSVVVLFGIMNMKAPYMAYMTFVFAGRSPVSSSCLRRPRISLHLAATFSGALCAVVQPECVIVTRQPPASSRRYQVTRVMGDTLVVNM